MLRNIHRKYQSMATILVTGASGLIGSKLCKTLVEEGHRVVALSRNHKTIAIDKVTTYQWNIRKKYIDKKAFKDIEYIIHLAGEDIAKKRWTKERKKHIVHSRIESTNLLFDYVKKLNLPLKKFISTSATGYYGAVSSSHIFNEDTPKGTDFLSDTCLAWEHAAENFSRLGITVCIFRLGVVLSNNGGAFPKMLRPIKWGFGAPVGNGRQYMPWIHIEDAIKLYLYAIEHNIEGVYNAVASEQLRNKKFMRSIAKAVHRPFFMPKLPSWALKTLMGKRSLIITEGSRVSNAKIKLTGYNFKYDTLDKALHSLVGE